MHVQRPTGRSLARTGGLTVAFAALALAGCGGGGSSSANLSPEAQEGERIARSLGCASCHGGDWGGAVGPGWKDLAGSTVKLDDGSTVVADAEYLTQAIADPGAARVAGYSVAMPPNSLTDAEIAKIVTFILELGGVTSTSSTGG